MSAAAVKPILYSYFRSSCSWRVRIALALKDIDYQYQAVNLIAEGGHQHSPSFQQINPVRFVPAFKIGDEILIESLAIIEYIDETFPGVNFLPKDPVKRAKSRAIAHAIASGIQPLQNLNVLQKLGEAGTGQGSSVLGDRANWARYWIDVKFDMLEKLLEKTAGKYCIGDEVTLADICLIPQVYNANRFGVDMTRFPIITRLVDNCQQLDAFQKSHPSQQPDCPPEMRNVK